MVANRVERVRESYGTLHATDKLQFINSVMLVVGVFGPLLLISSLFGVLDSLTSGLSIARGAQTAVEAMSIREFKKMTPTVGTRVRLSDGDLALGLDDVQRAQSAGYARVLAVPLRRETGDSDGSHVRVVIWEAPSSLIASCWYQQNITPSQFEEPQERTGLSLDGVVTDVTDESIHVMDLSRVPSVFNAYVVLALSVAAGVGGILLIALLVRLRRIKRQLNASLQQSRPILAAMSELSA